MPRRQKKNKVHEIKPDRIYNSKIISKLINNVMVKGKKSTAESIVYKALDIVAELTKKSATDVLAAAISKVTPLLRVKSRRIGSVNYQVPEEIDPQKGAEMALKYIVDAARKEKTKRKLFKSESMDKKKFSLPNSLAMIIIDSANNTGSAVKRKEMQHNMAEANKDNARYRW